MEFVNKLRNFEFGWMPWLVGGVAILSLASIAYMALSTSMKRPGSVGPRSEPVAGVYQRQSFLIYDPAIGKTARRTYEVWRSERDAGLEFDWYPEAESASRSGPVNGRGRLVWRKSGRSAHDRSAVVSIYEGELKDGRYESEGELHRRDGLSYRGAWHLGYFHGLGRLVTRDHEEYRGQFRFGAFEGQGVLMQPDGSSFIGSFQRGAKHGLGFTRSASGTSYESIWLNGAEDVASRRVRLAENDRQTATVTSPEPVRIGLHVENSSWSSETDSESGLFGRLVGYRSTQSTTSYSILPDDRRLMRVWKGGGAISEDTFEYGKNGYLFYTDVPLSVRIENTTDTPLKVDRVKVSVEGSTSDRQPVFGLNYPFNYSKNCVGPESTFVIVNHGWGKPETLKLYYRIGGSPGQELGPISGSPVSGTGFDGAVYQFEPDLGGYIDELKEYPFDFTPAARCRTGDSDAACLRKYADVVRKLGPKTTVKELLLTTRLSGRIAYTWRDSRGSLKESAAPVTFDLLLSGRSGGCAEAATPPDAEIPGRTKVRLSLDRANYQLSVPYVRTIAPKRNAVVALLLAADQSSQHTLRVVVEAAGRPFSSKRIELTYFRPRVDPFDLFKPEYLDDAEN